MSELIAGLREDRNLSVRERTQVLTRAAPQALVDLIEERRLNWLEAPILLLLSLGDDDDWEFAAPGANELGQVLKRRTDEIVRQLEWLRRKGLVEDDEDEVGTWWQVTERVDLLLHGATP